MVWFYQRHFSSGKTLTKFINEGDSDRIQGSVKQRVHTHAYSVLLLHILMTPVSLLRMPVLTSMQTSHFQKNFPLSVKKILSKLIFFFQGWWCGPKAAGCL